MKIKMAAIIDARQKVLNRYKFDNEQIIMQILPIQENMGIISEPKLNITLATVKYEQYGDMILEIPDAPVTPEIAELDKLKLQLKEIKQILTTVKLNPMHDRNIQVTRALRCLEIISRETE
jgi:hypothetical protein